MSIVKKTSKPVLPKVQQVEGRTGRFGESEAITNLIVDRSSLEDHVVLEVGFDFAIEEAEESEALQRTLLARRFSEVEANLKHNILNNMNTQQREDHLGAATATDQQSFFEGLNRGSWDGLRGKHMASKQSDKRSAPMNRSVLP
ncbi:hypothetical protein K491DRAFT_723468 [Lophiostoma macrostomum CBS 122681]|uniref:Uncharacterized protein n=1 Tax=Lophiostoma macrostomum CBS 122681 TaxID=1314788 RepID=A0A6A6SHY0_9PLEO|nr:hypothetical protein K491DRAFT_723468 [Lophiostoma macrostomum CBS 122681]